MSDFFIARQPIFDRDLQLRAYELLFRDCRAAESSDSEDQNAATAQVLTAVSELGVDNLVGDRLAYINLPERFLSEPDLLPLPPENLVLEVLETVDFSAPVISGMRSLGTMGYTLALDDFAYDARYDQALEMVSIVKLDIQLIKPGQWQSEIDRLKQKGLAVLAEKIETEEQYRQLRGMGCDLFQGFFFARPSTVLGKRPETNKASLLQLLSEVNDPATEPEQLAELVSRDVALSLRALNYVNSAASGLNRRIDSVRDAIIYLGRDIIRNWVTLYLMFSVDTKPSELVTMALVRARFCELLARELGISESGKFFTVGLFSTLDALLDDDMPTLLKHLSLTEDICTALINHEGAAGEALRMAIALEAGKAPRSFFDAVSQNRLAKMHIDAICWATGTAEATGVRRA